MLTHQSAMRLSGACPIPHTDLVLLPQLRMQKPQKAGDLLAYIENDQRYEAYRNRTGKEPPWAARLSRDCLTEIRLTYAMRNCEFQIVGNYPYTGISYLVTSSGLCERAAETFNLFRLDGIHQLGFLQAPTFNQFILGEKLSHGNRWIHSLDVMAIATLIGHNNKLSLPDLHTLRLAGLTHDMATPAGGDSVKLIDLQNLDEDANYPAQLDAVNWSTIAKDFSVDRSLLLCTIANQGLLGELLDIADKIAYTARDLKYCLHHLLSGKQRGYEGPGMIFSLVEKYPLVCSVWDSVVVQDGKPVFRDPERLFVFLKVRTLMFRELYYSSATRFGEYLVAELLAKLLYKRGVLTKEKLLSMRDEKLFEILKEEFGEVLFRIISQGAGVMCESFPTMEDAHVYADYLQKTGNPFVVVDGARRIKTGDTFWVMRDGTPQLFRDAYPRMAQELHLLATRTPLAHVLHLDSAFQEESKILQDLSAQLVQL